jgi:inhibitor of KinA
MGLYPEALFLDMGDRALLVEVGDSVSPEVNGKVRRMALAIEVEAIAGVVETVPTYRSLLVVYDPLILPYEELKGRLRQVEAMLGDISFPEPRTTRIPVVYGGTYGPDLEGVARHHGITAEEVVRLHTSRPYLIYLIGFMPGYPYMGELPDGLVTPRLKTPRLVVPAGSVGIAQRQTGIYSMESPGGWQILGRTPVRLFDPAKGEPALLRMGDFVQFYPIAEGEFGRWEA